MRVPAPMSHQVLKLWTRRLWLSGKPHLEGHSCRTATHCSSRLTRRMLKRTEGLCLLLAGSRRVLFPHPLIGRYSNNIPPARMRHEPPGLSDDEAGEGATLVPP